MIRTVLDINVLAAGFAGFDRPANTPGEVIRRWFDGQYQILISDYIMTKLESVLRGRYFSQILSPPTIQAILAILIQEGVPIKPPADIERIADHREDDLILAVALHGSATHLVTGDRAFRRIASYRDVVFVTPAEFIAILGAKSG